MPKALDLQGKGACDTLQMCPKHEPISVLLVCNIVTSLSCETCFGLFMVHERIKALHLPFGWMEKIALHYISDVPIWGSQKKKKTSLFGSVNELIQAPDCFDKAIDICQLSVAQSYHTSL